VAQNKLPDWKVYWNQHDNIEALHKMMLEMDDTLRRIEAEFSCKLLSGDHLLIIDALEERIDELESAKSANPVGVQGELF
jgi:hypothetical protein